MEVYELPETFELLVGTTNGRGLEDPTDLG